MLKNLKVVILHDWLTGFRGGERVLEVFCELFPDAPIYTLIHEKGSVPSSIENRKIVSSFLNHIPGVYKHYRKFLPIFPFAAEYLNIVENADLVLSSSHCVIKGVHKPIGSKHVSYIHSPMRYIYDQFDTYFGKDSSLVQRVGAHVCRPFLQTWDKMSNQNVDYLISNSNFVGERIKHYYNLRPTTIYPFVDTKDFVSVRDKLNKEDYYLMVSAFAPNKKVDLAIQTFNQLNKKLIIIGSGQQEAYLKSIAGPNIKFLGNVSRQEVVNHMISAKGFIFPGVEDFGITPLESLASGTPVIAFQKGGVLETLNSNVAEFFQEQSVDSLRNAILSFEEKSFNKNDLFSRADDFSKEIFKNNILNFIHSIF